jgi:hypothetical protein
LRSCAKPRTTRSSHLLAWYSKKNSHIFSIIFPYFLGRLATSQDSVRPTLTLQKTAYRRARGGTTAPSGSERVRTTGGVFGHVTVSSIPLFVLKHIPSGYLT